MNDAQPIAPASDADTSSVLAALMVQNSDEISVPEDRRRYYRHPYSEPVVLQQVDHDARPQSDPHLGTARDLQHEGIGVVSPHRIGEGELLTVVFCIDLHSLCMLAEVRGVASNPEGGWRLSCLFRRRLWVRELDRRKS